MHGNVIELLRKARIKTTREGAEMARSEMRARHLAPTRERRRPAMDGEYGIPPWQQRIWRGCTWALLGMILALLVIVAFTVWRAVALVRENAIDHALVFAGIALVTSNLLRVLAVLIGGAIAFVGLAVSFFVHEKVSSMNAQFANGDGKNIGAALATHSPGIVSVVIGAVVIVFALFAKGTHMYQPALNGQTGFAVESVPKLPKLKDVVASADRS